MRSTPVFRFSALLATVVAAWCITSEHAARAQHRIAGADSLHPLVRYADSLVSVNDRCIISGSGLNPAMHPVYVNEQPVGFC